MPAPLQFFEDFEPGQSYEFGSRLVTEQEILEFARAFDPQPIHIDPAAAAATPYGGLIASGWHSASIYMRLYVDAVLGRTASLGSPGVEELRWLVPVRPDDVVRGRATILETAPSRTRPERGTVISLCELLNQRDEVVLRFRVRGHFSRREPEPPARTASSAPSASSGD